MQVTVVGEPSLDATIRGRVTQNIKSALQSITTIDGRFVVNDTIWWMRKRRGGLAPIVVNSASFLSSKFQHHLGSLAGWKGETSLRKQDIDGFGTFELTTASYRLDRRNAFKFLDEYSALLPPDTDLGTLATKIYGMYVSRSLFDITEIPPALTHYFDPVEAKGVLRIGVEFETGNISSSFRALTKLTNLFSWGEIDAGVFITSIDKPSCAGRIWPVSNRNGSFQELTQRHYKANLALPLWEFGFAPDAFDSNAPYLGAKGSLYMPVYSGEDTIIDGRRYSVWLGESGEEMLQPKV